ncbi:LamG domain-containing protein [Paenibacillus sp. LjRoot153]|uniref:LamG-like jellyroll fold domain-containing protein n=1 Tax=Paenibacillus sp. LjRoot153 TaxID=3342270 RepID=UPI003ECEC3A9
MGNITIAVWVKWSGGSSKQWLYALGVDSTKYEFLTPKLWSGKLQSAINNETGVWKHVVTTIDSATKTSVLYLDGVAVATNKNVTAGPSELYDATKDYSGYIGKSFYADPYYAGQVDDFRIYSTALAPDKVYELCNASIDASQLVTEAKSHLSIGKNIVSSDINLPSNYNGTTITWNSSNTAYLGNDGKVDACGAAINAAKAIKDNVNATQIQVDNAVETLGSAEVIFKAAVIKVVSADLNKNGSLDVGDLAIGAYHYGKDSTSAGWATAKIADMNGDNIIDIIDIIDIAYIASMIFE